jgi:hypothetical protein
MINLINTIDDLIDLNINHPDDLKSTYRRFLMLGFTTIEASNLVATLLGLSACRDGWTLKQLNDILFMRYIRENKNT